MRGRARRVLSLLLMVGCALSWWSLGAVMGAGVPLLFRVPAMWCAGVLSGAVLFDRHLDRVEARNASWRRTLQEIKDLPEIPSG